MVSIDWVFWMKRLTLIWPSVCRMTSCMWYWKVFCLFTASICWYTAYSMRNIFYWSQWTGYAYGYSECRNVPRPLDNDHIRSTESKLSQSGTVAYIVYIVPTLLYCVKSASQMWLLGRLLPLMVGKYVPVDDAHWRCYVQLRILCIATAVEVTVDTVSVLIQEYLAMFNHLYPHTITPKLHYLLHLPRQMQL